MSRKPIPDDFDMDTFLSGKKSKGGKEGEHGENTESIRREHGENTEERDFKKYQDSKFDTLTVRLLPKDIQRLKYYYEKRGVPVSQGLRALILDFMERQGI